MWQNSLELGTIQERIDEIYNSSHSEEALSLRWSLQDSVVALSLRWSLQDSVVVGIMPQMRLWTFFIPTDQ